jgi:guanylate kinase
MSNEKAPARRGLMLVLSSPSGAGKSTLSRRLLEADDRLSMSVSATTRPPRTGEEDGVHYFFKSRTAFEADIAADAFLEHAVVFDNLYGTPRAPVEAALAQGRDVLFDVDWQGARAIKASAGESVVSVFVLPPSLAELHRRLRQRAQDDEAVIARRMAKAVDEIAHWDEYEYVLVNDSIDDTYAALVAILQAERLKRTRQVWLGAFVDGLHAEG